MITDYFYFSSKRSKNSKIKRFNNHCEKQFRKKKRSLHEATARKGRKTPNKTQKRNSKNTKYQNGFHLNDKVRLFGKVGFISGFTNGGCYVKDIENSYITIPDKTYKQVSFKHLEFICHNNNWQFISRL